MAKKVTKAEFQAIIQQTSYRKVCTLAAVFIGIGGVFYHFVEKFSWLDSFYFTVISLATVGYGDFAPKTVPGKLFTMVYVMLGITIFIVLAKLILASMIIHRKHHDEDKDQ